jgi:carbonic anhydrase/acetyltransferase-like protein (isoleucine patch superfamily)
MLHGCEIGDNSLIGIGSIILNRAKIGPNCLIGAHSLVTERKEIPEGSLVMGSPGKVVRQLTPEEIEGIRMSAREYVRNWQRFARDLASDESADHPVVANYGA